MTEDDPGDWYRGPNDDAYVHSEERTGPPLDYVASKLRQNLEWTHQTLVALREHGDNIELKGGMSVHWHVAVAFHYAVKSYLALQNMLALANDDKLYQRLEGYTKDEFRDWLDRIQHQGSVTGD